MQLVVPVVVHSHLAIIFVLNSYNSPPHYERGNIAVKHRFSKMFPRSLRAQKTFAGEAKSGWLRKHFSSFDYRIQLFCWQQMCSAPFQTGNKYGKTVHANVAICGAILNYIYLQTASWTLGKEIRKETGHEVGEVQKPTENVLRLLSAHQVNYNFCGSKPQP